MDNNANNKQVKNVKADKELSNNSKAAKGKEKLQEKGMKATKKYLETRGYEVLDTNFECEFGKIDVISKDRDTLVFTSLEILDKGNISFPKDAYNSEDRSRLECIMANYLQNNDYVDMQVRFDSMKLLVLSDDKAFIRYHVNALGPGNKPYDTDLSKSTKDKISNRAKTASDKAKPDKNLSKQLGTHEK